MSDKRVVTIHRDLGYQTGVLVAEGPKWIQVIFPDATGISITKVPNDRSLKMVQAVYREKPYPVARAANKILRMGRRVGITKSARQALRGSKS